MVFTTGGSSSKSQSHQLIDQQTELAIVVTIIIISKIITIMMIVVIDLILIKANGDLWYQADQSILHITPSSAIPRRGKKAINSKILGFNFEMHKKFNEHFKLNFLCIWLYWKMGVSIKVQMQMQSFSLVHRTTQNLSNASKMQMQMQNLMTYEPVQY